MAVGVMSSYIANSLPKASSSEFLTALQQPRFSLQDFVIFILFALLTLVLLNTSKIRNYIADRKDNQRVKYLKKHIIQPYKLGPDEGVPEELKIYFDIFISNLTGKPDIMNLEVVCPHGALDQQGYSPSPNCAYYHQPFNIHLLKNIITTNLRDIERNKKQ